MHRIALIALAALLLLAPAAHAQQPAGRDTLAGHALVLSGGGARGISHAGALLALEERGYSVPIVVGTSMGAIIGALYAAGLAPDEIRRVAAGEEWIARFVADPVPVGPARTPLRPLLDLGIGGRNHDGLLPAHGVSLRLVELLFDAGARARNDFDRLPRRFRAVATDLATGGEVVLADFDLPRAVRASMSVPGAFPPVAWQDRVLVDGGIANNLPVSVARSLTGLPVIAVDVLRPAPTIEERGPLDVGIRSLRLLIDNARPDADGEADIVVRPPLRAGFAEMWFPRDPSRLLRTGYEAAREQLPQQPGAPAPAAPPGPPPAGIRAVIATGGDAALNALVERITAPLAGPYDAAHIVARTRALHATNLFQAVWPRLEFETDDETTATLVVDVTPATRSGIAAAARWDSDVGAGAWALLRHRVSLHRPVELRGGGVWDALTRRATLDASIFSTALPGVIWNAGMHAGEERIRDVDDGTILGVHGVRRAGAWAGGELSGDGFVSLLGRIDYVRDRGASGSARPAVDAWTAGPFLRIGPAPDPDRVVGILPMLEGELRFGGLTYQRVRAAVSAAFTSGNVSAAPLLDVDYTAGDAPADAMPASTRELAPWLTTGSLRAPLRATAGVDVAHPLVMNGFARLRLRMIGSSDAWSEIDRREAWRAGAELGAVWPSVIGIIELGVARGAGGDWRVNAGVGPAFR